MGIMEYLQALRLEQTQRHKNHKQYLDSLRRNKRQLCEEFGRISERLNREILEIGQSRLHYELYEQIN